MTATPAQGRPRRIAAGAPAGSSSVPGEVSQRGSAATVPSTPSATAAGDQHARRASNWARHLILWAVVLVLLGALAHTGRVLINHRAEPDAAVVLEGDPARIRYAAQFAKAHPELPIYISSEPVFYQVYLDALAQEQVPLERFALRTCASDTLTNFTCIADELRQHGYRHLYLITSEHHMPRALTTGRIVLGRHGMAVTPRPRCHKPRGEGIAAAHPARCPARLAVVDHRNHRTGEGNGSVHGTDRRTRTAALRVAEPVG